MKMGKIQNLCVKRLTSVGAFLNTEDADTKDFRQDVLLPKKYIPEGTKTGDSIRVFVSRDSEDRPIATTRFPKAEVGEFALLNVVQVSKIGAFLDWGLEKDLFLPFTEQLHRVKPQEKVLVYLYIDKSGRICGTMRVSSHFQKPKHLKENDWVDGIVYSVHPEIGVFVLVEGKYSGLLPKGQYHRAFRVGEEIRLRIAHKKKDGKLDLSLQSRAHEHMDEDAEKIYALLKQRNGFLPYHDKSSPDEILRVFGLSKSQFKRAVGRLLKEKKITQASEGLRLVVPGKGRQKGKKG